MENYGLRPAQAKTHQTLPEKELKQKELGS
jgi:hypothetical protein